MDHTVRQVLRFDRFALDLARGCLRGGDQEIDLRPKTFDVLCHLAENAGRLVSKQELFEVVWPNVTVGDDSLVQCIRELRQKLGDEDRRLIKTVPGRGYLLVVAVSAQPPQSLSSGPAAAPAETPQKPATRLDALHRVLRTIPAHELRIWGAAVAGFMCIALGIIYLLGPLVPVVKPEHVSLAKNVPPEPHPRPTFKHCTDCPEMVALPAGKFLMGSPVDDPDRDDVEGPLRRVVVPKPIAIGKFEITVNQFSAFVDEIGTSAGNLCQAIVGTNDNPGNPFILGLPEASFRMPGFAVTGDHPVVCINWHDTQEYVAWLRRRTGKPYRLPTEAEWEYAARASTQTRYSFGNDSIALCAHGRVSYLDHGNRCDHYLGPISVGQLKPNRWGIFDMHGNASEWVEDCWTPDASKIPTDGSAFSPARSCLAHVVRGGSWANRPRWLRSAARREMAVEIRENDIGFRVALSLGE
jgi:sulfatase modifying factor 1